MATITIRDIQPSDRDWISAECTRHFGSAEIDSRGELFDVRELPGMVAVRGDRPIALLCHTPLRGAECEVVALASAAPRQGAATALLEACIAAARAAECRRVFLTTSNDNTSALRFYQKRGWRMVRIDRDAITRARRRSPTIPLHGHDGILIADEIELEMCL